MKILLITYLAFCGLLSAHAQDENPSEPLSEHQGAIDECIAAWKKSPFKKGTPPNKILKSGVKVFGIGNSKGDTIETDEPNLVLVRPSVNVLGVTTIQLLNPKGWYCFKSNVSVLGKIEIEVDCKAHVASVGDGTNVLGDMDEGRGVNVLGVMKVKRIGCPGKPKKI